MQKNELTIIFYDGSEGAQLPSVLTRHITFSTRGKLIGHWPVCGWLRAATGVLKRRANAVTKGWDDIVDDDSLKQMMAETLTRVRRSDPAWGEWHVSGHKLNAWVYTSSLATGMVLKWFGTVIVQSLLPMTFAYSLSSEAVVMRYMRKWKRLWQRSLTCSHKRTSIGPSKSCWSDTSALQPEEITLKGTRVSCVYYPYLPTPPLGQDMTQGQLLSGV